MASEDAERRHSASTRLTKEAWGAIGVIVAALIAAIASVITAVVNRLPNASSEGREQTGNATSARAQTGDATSDQAAPRPTVERDEGHTMHPRDLVGRWHWDGLPCEAGPVVILNDDRLIFRSPGEELVHAIVATDDNNSVLRTQVVEPSSHRGERYRFTFHGHELVLYEENAGETNVWQRCTL